MTLLEEQREIINECNVQLMDAFEKRMKAVTKVAQYKQENNLPVYDPAREKLVIEKCVAMLNDHEMDEFAVEFIQDVMDIAKKYEEKILGRK